METLSFSVENLCVPCRCRCRHCLLAWEGAVPGADYAKGKMLARRLAAESPLPFTYYIGFCMDTPDLLDYIAFCREIGSPGGKFLQMNGFHMQTAEEIRHLMGQIRDAGAERIDLTFYGLPASHDRFAGRPGDFDFLLEMFRAAREAGLLVQVSAPITEENAAELEPLIRQLEPYGPEDIRLFLPHCKGRGRYLEEQRLRAATLRRLPEGVRACMPRVLTQTEAEWLAQGVFPAAKERQLTLCLTQENFPRYEHMPAAEIIRELEAMDDAFYGAVPPPAELAALYGDPNGDRLFRYRDLVLLWTKRYAREHGLAMHDPTEERGHFSLRQ